MFRLGAAYFFAVTSILALIAVGTLLFWQDRQREDAAVLERCVAEMLSRDPAQDVQSDLSEGEDRFFFVWHGGIATYEAADGVEIAGYKGHNGANICQPTESVGRAKPQPWVKFSSHLTEPGNHCCDRDPPRTSCGMAVASYIRYYNREMAETNPKSVLKYCKK